MENSVCFVFHYISLHSSVEMSVNLPEIDPASHEENRIQYSPWARRGHRAPLPPLLFKSCTILFRGLLGMILAMLPEKKLGRNMGFGHFSKWPP